MKIKHYFIPFFFLIAGMHPAAGQQEAKHPDNTLNMVAPAIPGIEYAAPANMGGPDVTGQVQIISTESERGAGTVIAPLSPAAVPVNNNCANAITLTVNAPCINGTNKEANIQTGENTACQGAVTKTVWYKFVATSSAMFVEVERTASSGCYLSSAVYSGNCLPSSSISCEDAALGPNLNIHNLTGLTIGTTYYVQVSYTGGSVCGNNSNTNTGANFCIKVGEPQNCSTCNAPCGPVCVFPTAPTVAQVTGTCPAYPLKSRLNAGQSKTQCYTFTAIAADFSLQMIINASGCSVGNVSTFNWELYPANCSGVVQSGTLSNLNASGLTIGTPYVLCYTWVATCQHNTVYPYIVATSPLPVELLAFSGRQIEKNMLLKWSTASETGNDYFSIQRSADGIHFEETGKVQGAGNSTSLLNYTFTDHKPLKGVNYYRLAQYDFDGTVEHSEIIALRFFENSYIKIENNPVGDQLQINVQANIETEIAFEIINYAGMQVARTSRFATKGFNSFLVPLEDFSDGVYFLKTETDEGVSWMRFIKLYPIR